MKITEYVNDMKWGIPGMLCDNPIHSQIRDPLPNTAHFMALCGAAGSGKTSLEMSMLTHDEMYHKVFSHIFVVMPPNSRASLKGDPFKDHPKEKLFDELTYEVLEFVLAFCEVASRENQHSVLILDDCAAELKNSNIQKILKQLIFNRRHLKLSIHIMTQSYNAMPLSIRKNISHCVCFKPRNRKELEALFSELVFLDKKDQLKLFQHIFDVQYNFMFVNTALNKFYKNFNELALESN